MMCRVGLIFLHKAEYFKELIISHSTSLAADSTCQICGDLWDLLVRALLNHACSFLL